VCLCQGWSVELDVNIKQHRTFATNAKLETIFVAATKLRQLEIMSQESAIAVRDSERAIQCVRRQREAALKNLWRREACKIAKLQTFAAYIPDICVFFFAGAVGAEMARGSEE